MPDQPLGTKRAPAPEAEAAATMLLRAQYLKDLSFENIEPAAAVERLATPRGEANVEVDFDHLRGRLYEVRLRIKVEAKVKEHPAYMLEVLYAGIFEIPEALAARQRKLLLVRAPALLFPFARALVHAMTMEGGYPALLLNPIDFRAVARARRQAAKEASAKSDS